MAGASGFSTLILNVGQQAEITLNFEGDITTSLWLLCDEPSIVVPALPDGTPTTWPYSLNVTDGVAVYRLLGVGTGAATYYLSTVSDPDSSTPILAEGSVLVTTPEGDEGSGTSSGGELELLVILEPILITVVPVPPAGGPL